MIKTTSFATALLFAAQTNAVKVSFFGLWEDDDEPEFYGCECMSSIGSAGEKVCEDWNFNVDECLAIGSCHWGPGELEQCQ